MDVVPRSAGTPTDPTTAAPAPPPAPETRPSWYGPVSTAAVVGAATLYTALVNPNTSGAFPQCITKRFTGLDCPMCGGLRTVHALSHGDLAGALDHNALVVVLLPLVAVAWALWSARSLGVEVPRFRWPRWAPWAAIAFAIVFAVVRNTAVPGLAWLDSGV
jgi:hypothetical protein